MRILMTNHALHHIGGTETWTETVATELVNRGHDVEIATLIPGMMAGRMPCRVRQMNDLGDDTWDLMIVNHNTCLAMVQRRPGFKIFTSHGPAHNLEKPCPGADAYVAVSEEIAATYPQVRATIIRQPIDLRRFRPQPALETDADVLVMTKNADAAQLAAIACKKAGLTHNLAHYTLRPCLDVSDLIPMHRAVITSGRGILESLACGVPVFCFNHSQGELFGDRWVTQEKLQEMQCVNYSGRSGGAFGKIADGSNVVDVLAGHLRDGLIQTTLDNASMWGPAWIEAHHDVHDICDQYLALAGGEGTGGEDGKRPLTYIQEAVR